MRARAGNTLFVVMSVLVLLGILAFAFQSQVASSRRLIHRAYLGQLALAAAKGAVDEAVADWLKRARPPIDGGQLDDNLKVVLASLKLGEKASVTHPVREPLSPTDATVALGLTRSVVQWKEFLPVQVGNLPMLDPKHVDALRAQWRKMYLTGT